MAGQQSLDQFEKKVKDTINEYRLVRKRDKVLIACSGGKDSTATLYLLKKFGYNVEALIIDLMIGDWSDKNLKNVRKFCRKNKIRLHVVDMMKEFGCSICNIRSGIQSKRNLGNCMICGVIKRWLLNKKARELGATKIATGHNLDDEAETVLMNLLKGNPKLSLAMGPSVNLANNKKFVERIKPLYFCTNDEVRKYSKAMKFPVIYEPCPCSFGAFRSHARKFLSELEKGNPEAKINIVKNFLGIMSAMRKAYSSKGKIKHCSICGEPSKNKTCMRCELSEIFWGK